MNVVIPNQELLRRVKAKIKEKGAAWLHVLADFDRTLTYWAINWVKTPSIISLLRDGKHLSEEYAAQAHALYNKYAPFETDTSISLEERKKLMKEWRETHNKLLIESGLSISDMEDIVKTGHLKFREGIAEFLDLLHAHNVPLVILSASGCGDAIQMFFAQAWRDYPNIHYVTNQFDWDSSGRAVSTKWAVIHSLNKDETVLEEIPQVYAAVRDRKNVILLWDSLWDLWMITGFDYDNLIKIWFLNFDYSTAELSYLQNFDVVLEWDKDFHYVGQLMTELV